MCVQSAVQSADSVDSTTPGWISEHLHQHIRSILSRFIHTKGFRFFTLVYVLVCMLMI